MKWRATVWRSVMVCACVGTISACANNSPAPPAAAGDVLARVPLSFEVNQGQADPQVRFVSRGPGHVLQLKSDHASLQVSQKSGQAAVNMKLRDANAAPQIEAVDPQPGQINYLLGNDPAKWHIDVPHYARVRYREVYPGVDLVFYGNQQQLEYDFVVSPRTDPDTISIAFEGAERLQLNARGDLVMDAEAGRIEHAKPIVYQELNGSRKYVDGNFVLKGGNEVGFAVASYDKERALVIDPTLNFLYYGPDGTIARDIATDDTGNVYIGGSTTGTALPTMSPFQGSPGGGVDAWIAKFGPGGSPLIYATYFGGAGDDFINSLAVGGRAGNAYFTGSTSSTNLPTMLPIQSANGGGIDAFVAELNAAGNGLVFSTYQGGAGEDRGMGITLDGSNNIYITGFTASNNFPTLNPFQPTFGGGPYDAFFTKLNSSGTRLERSTYAGGPQLDQGMAIFWDLVEKKLAATGRTSSTAFPTTPDAFQRTTKGLEEIFFMAFDDALNTTYSTFIGGSLNDVAVDIASGPNGIFALTGRTSSPDFPLSSPLQPVFGGGEYDAFILLARPGNNTPSFLTASSYLGGSGADSGNAVAFNSLGRLLIVGGTDSRNFPVVNPDQAAFAGGPDDVWWALFEEAGLTRPNSVSYYGGPGADAGFGALLEPRPDILRFFMTGRSVEGPLDRAFLTYINQSIRTPR